jgi:hypothetical protein
MTRGSRRFGPAVIAVLREVLRENGQRTQMYQLPLDQ